MSKPTKKEALTEKERELLLEAIEAYREIHREYAEDKANDEIDRLVSFFGKE